MIKPRVPQSGGRSCNRLSKRLAFTILGLLSAGQVPAAGPTDYLPLVRQLNEIRQAHRIPGYAIQVVSADRQHFAHMAGYARVEPGTPVTDATLFRIGSITKTFTALAIMQLQEEGKLNINEPVIRYTPDAPIDNPWRHNHPVTIAHLLEHTSGLMDLSKAEFAHSDPAPLSLSKGLFFSGPRRVHWQPGRFFSYSNAGAGYAAYVLEKVAETSYEHYIRQHIFTPLGMTRASLILDKETSAHLADGYDRDGRTRIPYWHTILRPFGSINATPEEMGRFVRMLMNYGAIDGRRFMNKTAIERMERPQTSLAARHGLRHGYGLGIYQYVSHGKVFYGHGGDGDGYLSHFAYNRELDRGYFFVMNAFHYPALSEFKEAIEGFLSRPHRKTAVISDGVHVQKQKRILGKYRKITLRFPWEKKTAASAGVLFITSRNGELFVTDGDGRKRTIYGVYDGLYRFGDEPTATIAIVEDNGKVYFLGEDGNYEKQHEN